METASATATTGANAPQDPYTSPSTAHRSSSESTHRGPPAFEQGLDDYIKTVTALAEKFKTAEPEDMGFDAVVQHQDDYKGRLIRSTVFLVNGFPRGIRVVSNEADVTHEGELMIPSAIGVGLRAQRIYKAHGHGCRVVVIYGIVSPDNRTLFDISPDQPEG